jgi:hypothetical protein
VPAILANAAQSLTRTGTTDPAGAVTFQWNKAPAGTYPTTVTGVLAAGLTWDRGTPYNSYVK